MIKQLLNTKTKSVSFAALILAGSYFVSALLELLRDRLLGGHFGAGNELDVYYAAFTIPDFIALILIFGAVSAAIIPIFSSYLVSSKEEAWHYVSLILNIFLTFLICVCILLIVLAPLLINLIAPGFSETKKEMTVLLMRIMFLSPIILGTSSIVSGILQVFHKFLVTALAPIMYNSGIIIGILFFVPHFGLSGLAWGVVLGALMHLLIQIPAFLNSGFTYAKIQSGFKNNFDIGHPGIKKTFILMAPRSLGLGAGQINTMVITAIASTLATGSVAVYNLANNLSFILINAISISLSTAVFPAMALAYSKDDTKDFKQKFSGAFSQMLFLCIPISIAIFLLRAQVVRVILGTGRFSWIDTRLTAACLGVFSLGLCAHGLILLLAKTFYAAHNTKIPALVSIGTVAFNIVMSLFFIKMLGFNNFFSDFLRWGLRLEASYNITVIGLVLAFTITAITEALLLLLFINQKLNIFQGTKIAASVCKTLIAGGVMGVVIFLVRDSLVRYHFVGLQTFWGVFVQLAVSGGFGVICYTVASFLLKSEELRKLKSLFYGSRTH